MAEEIYLPSVPETTTMQEKIILMLMHNPEMSFNELWRNLGNWQFENVTAESGTRGGGSPTLGAAWFDANGDAVRAAGRSALGTC